MIFDVRGSFPIFANLQREKTRNVKSLDEYYVVLLLRSHHIDDVSHRRIARNGQTGRYYSTPTPSICLAVLLLPTPDPLAC